MLVVTQVRQAPQHACVAGAISAARFSTGSARVVARSSTLSLYAAKRAGGFANARGTGIPAKPTTPAQSGSRLGALHPT